MRSEQAGGQALALRETVLNSTRGKLLVWQVLWSGGHYTPSNVIGKLRQAESRLRFQGDDGAMIALAAPFAEDQDNARAALRAFLDDNFEALDATLTAAREK